MDWKDKKVCWYLAAGISGIGACELLERQWCRCSYCL